MYIFILVLYNSYITLYVRNNYCVLVLILIFADMFRNVYLHSCASIPQSKFYLH